MYLQVTVCIEGEKVRGKAMEQPCVRLRAKRPHADKSLTCIVLILFVEYMCDFLAPMWYDDLVLMCSQHLNSSCLRCPSQCLSQSVSQSVRKQLSTELIKDADNKRDLSFKAQTSSVCPCYHLFINQGLKATAHPLFFCICVQDFEIKLQPCKNRALGILASHSSAPD